MTRAETQYERDRRRHGRKIAARRQRARQVEDPVLAYKDVHRGFLRFFMHRNQRPPTISSELTAGYVGTADATACGMTPSYIGGAL